MKQLNDTRAQRFYGASLQRRVRRWGRMRKGKFVVPSTDKGCDDMKISLLDRSLYLKGLMLLIRKDRKIDAAERTMAVRIGKMLGFEKKFCENVIEELMDNKYIVDLPPRFSAPDIAGCFIKDGLKLSFVDGHIHENELIWLRAVAETNSLEDAWYDDAVKTAADQGCGDLEDILEVKNLEWE